MAKACRCRWQQATMLNGVYRGQETHVHEVCDVCAPTDLDKLRVQLERQMEMASDLRNRFEYTGSADQERIERMTTAMMEIQRLSTHTGQALSYSEWRERKEEQRKRLHGDD